MSELIHLGQMQIAGSWGLALYLLLEHPHSWDVRAWHPLLIMGRGLWATWPHFSHSCHRDGLGAKLEKLLVKHIECFLLPLLHLAHPGELRSLGRWQWAPPSAGTLQCCSACFLQNIFQITGFLLKGSDTFLLEISRYRNNTVLVLCLEKNQMPFW